MILVLGGTSDARDIAAALAGAGFRVLVTVVSEYGREAMDRGMKAEVMVGALDAEGLQKLIGERDIKLIVDATHPYAGLITGHAWEAARKTATPYIRYERPPVAGTGEIHRVQSYREAAQLAVTLGDILFLTIGSKNLEPFVTECRRAGKKLLARVLPDAGVLGQCAALGLGPDHIIAVKGPFSLEMNLAMLKEYRADVLVTKDSGTAGGTDTKLEAAARLGIPVVMVARPGSTGLPMTDRLEDIMEMARSLMAPN